MMKKRKQKPPRRRLLLSSFDVNAIRSVLRGESVIDWHRLHFTNEREVARFLRLNEFHVEVAADMEYLERLREEAVEYLKRTFLLKIPPDIAGEIKAKDLLLVASGKGKNQLTACTILKVMLILHHLDGHEVDYRLPVSRDELSSLVEAKVVQVVEEIRAADVPVIEFSWSRKSRDSLITKLLSKTDTIATRVYDRLRFRIIVKEKNHLVPLLWELLHRLIPFNYIIPGESANSLLHTHDIERFVGEDIADMKAGDSLGIPQDKILELKSGPSNEFSSPDYRIINFVTDLPIRVEPFMNRVPFMEWKGLVPMTFVLAEFQIADWATAKANEQGDCNHEQYKQRQLKRVRVRLMKSRAKTKRTQQEEQKDVSAKKKNLPSSEPKRTSRNKKSKKSRFFGPEAPMISE